MAYSFILASRSPRRRELLEVVVPAHQIIVMPPGNPAEASFEGLHRMDEIRGRLAEIARQKAQDIAAQLAAAEHSKTPNARYVIIAADTAVVVSDSDGKLFELGQPPVDDSWKDSVRHWFREYYVGRTHQALTALCVLNPDGRIVERIVSTDVTFVADIERHLEWYLNTKEPRGKAGGYAIQGAASIFISRIAGSLTNVVGLPLEALLETFHELQIDISR